MQHVTDRVRNPFGMTPPCAEAVPGYGDVNADFHVVGDRPAVHGGVDTGVPFTATTAAERLQRVLAETGLLESTGAEPTVESTFLSYLHMCVADGDDDPSASAYADLERFFDAEVRAIAAHVLLPVGERATDHVLRTYTAKGRRTDVDMDALHGEEVVGSGWLVLPVKEPAAWTDADEERLTTALTELRATDFRRESDLGRFLPGDDPYLVR